MNCKRLGVSLPLNTIVNAECATSSRTIVFALKRGVVKCASSRVRKICHARSNCRGGRMTWSIFTSIFTIDK